METTTTNLIADLLAFAVPAAQLAGLVVLGLIFRVDRPGWTPNKERK